MKQRTVFHVTFLRQKELDKEFKMLTWVQREVGGVGGKNVTALFNVHNV